MVKNLFVGNIPYACNEEEIRELFETYGKIKSVKLIRDYHSDRPKGYGFVEIFGLEEKDIETLNGIQLRGRALRVNDAEKGRKTKQGGSSQRAYL